MTTDIKPVTNMDFNATKEELKQFLRDQEQFKDFDYEGSNMNVLLDVLSYNTFYNSYYYNMAISEMFLDSASQRNSVISHAKELNYLPRSRRSAIAKVNIVVTYPNYDSNYFNIPKDTPLIGRCGNRTYTFLTDKAHSAVRSPNNPSRYIVNGVEVFEGRIITELLSVGNTLISNDGIDTRSLELSVNGIDWLFKTDIYGLKSNDKVFFLQPENDGKYSVQFGKNSFGIEPTITDVIQAKYRLSSGAAANGVTSLTLGAFGGASSIDITVVEQSGGGVDSETIESIRTFAPKALQIQERAITTRDYETLLRTRFPNIQAISVYGGDEVDPPQFGKVIISVDVVGGEGVADYEIANFKRYLKDKTPLTIETVFVSAKYMFVDTTVNVVYDPNLTSKSASQIRAEVQQAVIDYQNANLNDFKKTYRQSNLAASIDRLETSIMSSDIVAKPIIEYIPDLGISASPSFSFETQLVKPYPYDEDNGFSGFKPAVSSTKFTVDNTRVSARDDGNGNIMLVISDPGGDNVFKPSVGTIDYTTGIVRLIDVNITQFDGTAIQFTASSVAKDITPPKDRIIVIRGSDVKVNVTPVEST